MSLRVNLLLIEPVEMQQISIEKYYETKNRPEILVLSIETPSNNKEQINKKRKTNNKQYKTPQQ